MLGALIALPMVFVWVSYVALTVVTITTADLNRLIGWLVITPIVLGGEVLAFRLLDRTMKFG